MGSHNLKKPKSNAGKLVSAPAESSPYSEIKHPVFCFRYLHSDYSISILDQDEKEHLLNKLYLLSQQSWGTIDTSHRHKLGYEKIEVDQIKPQINSEFTEDVKKYYVFRFCGMKPLLGHRRGIILHLLFLDPKMELYDHD